MNDRITLKGEITVEIIRKNGKIEKHTENLLTTFGKSYCLANGINRPMNYSSGVKDSKLRIGNETIYPWNQAATEKTGNTLLCNLLWNGLPNSISQDTSLFMPDSDSLIGYAYDGNTTGSKQGQVVNLNDGQAIKNQIVHKFQYGSDLHGSITHIGMSTSAPDGAGAIASVLRSIAHGVYSSGNMSYYWPKSDGTLYSVFNSNPTIADLSTGELEAATAMSHHRAIASYQAPVGLFKWGNYIYVIDPNRGRYGPQPILYVLNINTGVQINAYNLSGKGLCVKEGHLYMVYDLNASTTIYEVTQNLDGTLNFSGTGESYTTPWNGSVVSVAGDMDTGNIYNITDTNYIYSDKGACIGVNADNLGYSETFNLGGRLFNFVNQRYSFENHTPYYLREYGNLLSWHEFGTPIVKNIGDTLFVTYSYTV